LCGSNRCGHSIATERERLGQVALRHGCVKSPCGDPWLSRGLRLLGRTAEPTGPSGDWPRHGGSVLL
jgi:hypothetical protein